MHQNQEKKSNGKQYLQLISEKADCSIKQDSQIEDKVLQNLEAEYSKLRNEVHVSDLVLCMRQALFRKLQPMPPTRKQLGYYLDGQRRHETLQKIYGQGIVEKEGTFEDVKYHIDILDEFPIEFKSTRAKNAISEHWIRQVIYYAIAVNSRKALLQIQRINPRSSSKTKNAKDGDNEEENLFPSFLIQLSEQQKDKWSQDFATRRNLFFEAFRSKNPSKLPIYRGDGNWICKECPYKVRCDLIEGVNVA